MNFLLVLRFLLKTKINPASSPFEMYRFLSTAALVHTLSTGKQRRDWSERRVPSISAFRSPSQFTHTHTHTHRDSDRGRLCIWSCKYLMCRARSERASSSMRNLKRKRSGASITRSTELSARKRRKGLDVDQDGCCCRCCLTSRKREAAHTDRIIRHSLTSLWVFPFFFPLLLFPRRQSRQQQQRKREGEREKTYYYIRVCVWCHAVGKKVKGKSQQVAVRSSDDASQQEENKRFLSKPQKLIIIIII